MSTPELGIDTLEHLPVLLRDGLTGVAVLGFLSFFASVTLFFLLIWRLFTWSKKKQPYNQFVLLIFNLILADIQQSLAFLLNAAWLIRDEITVGSTTCWAQAWFVSTGDLASGVWCFAIGVHTFASIILNYKLGNKMFFFAIFVLWVFTYAMAVLQVALHPDDIYVRAGAWCWVNSAYPELRLWTHYFFIFVAEFGVILIYSLMFFILNARVKTRYFSAPEMSEHARQAANLMVVYPIVYVVCTLPLASARMASMTGHDPSFVHYCIAGAMITSNGWIDVLLYTLTRRIMLFSDTPPDDNLGLETFQMPFWGAAHQRFGTTTTIQAIGKGKGDRTSSTRGRRSDSRTNGRLGSRSASRQSSTEQLFTLARLGDGVVKAETTVEVHSEPIEMEDIAELKDMAHRALPPPISKEDSMSLDAKSFNLDLERDYEPQPSPPLPHHRHHQYER